MMDHLQSVHPNEPDVAKALTFDKNSQERKHLLNLLQTKGNVLHGTNVQSRKQDLKPFRMFASDCSFDDSVYCIYCLGLFSKKSFATHLEQCKGKSIDRAEDSCGEIPPDAGPIPSTSTLTSLWSPEEIDANLEPSGFYCLNSPYESEQLNLYNEQESSFHQGVTCSVGQPDVSSPNKGVRNDGQTEGAKLQFKRSPEYEVSYDFKSDNFSNPSPGQESTDCKNEEIRIPICDVDPERTMTENDVLRNPCDDFSPPHGNQTVSNDSVKAQTYGTRRKRKRSSRVQNESPIMDYDLLGEGERPNSKIHVCQHCRATFCTSYTLRRHEYTHTGDTLTSTDQQKLKRPKRRIQGGETSVKDEASLEPSAESPKDLPDAVNDDTEGKVTATKQDTEVRGFHWEEAGHSKVKDYDTDC
ncbi:uncharacterized protein LOC130075206 isoform X3 [Rhinichthys klamathensis goyatoka]|uniref:uncharacterized protein LOC130075206 isoform X3 n=1 Tax=Rhinichthys klamathensis goyatoka TaxID=3034132 RepID=UPI0024B53CA7|nr:uncharacterized protein LOC130075206 isoform X3 [Rhinichthys klamathensis goyatoka]